MQVGLPPLQLPDAWQVLEEGPDLVNPLLQEKYAVTPTG